MPPSSLTKLPPLSYQVTQNKATESSGTGKFLHHNKDGTYSCIVCGHPLFSSDSKFESGSGWPSFRDVVDKGDVKFSPDDSHGLHRTEVSCAYCGAHLGHVFDYAKPGDKGYYCINSASLDFKSP